ncbi:MAG TPA: transglycosylase SLT domain-containing protein [Vicinamibacteria bacterium]|nr:transglycosylase SLT domain-containing protein [Vicinamibacteria bacterium]
MTLKASQVLHLALGAGFSRRHADVMTAVAWYESGWDPNNIGDQSLSRYGSRGLWQIFTGAHTPHELGISTHSTWTPTDIAVLTRPQVNAHAAHVVFQEQGYRAWSTWNSYNNTAAFKALVAKIAALTPASPTPTPVPAPVPAPPAPAAAEAVTDALAEVGKSEDHNLCLVFVRTMFDVGPMYPTAASAWIGAQYKHVGDTNPPSGVPVWWSGGSSGAGHVALSIGNGKIVSSDIAGGRVGLVPLAKIHDAWGLNYLGWSEDIDGKRVWGA